MEGVPIYSTRFFGMRRIDYPDSFLSKIRLKPQHDLEITMPLLVSFDNVFENWPLFLEGNFPRFFAMRYMRCFLY